MESQSKRRILLLKNSINKIIKHGIEPNLQKLDKSTFIIKNNCSRERLSQECMNARLTIQQLRSNLTELEKCFLNLKEFKNQPDYETMIESTKKDVQKHIENFIKVNSVINDELVNNQINYENQSDKTQETEQIYAECDNLNSANQRLQEVQSINQDLHDLQELMCKFGHLVQEQQSTIDHIEENIEIAAENIHEGTKSLAKAASTTVAPIACGAIGAAICGPIGGLISFKVSAGLISAIGGSAVSFSLASYVKKRYRKQAEAELEELSCRNDKN